MSIPESIKENPFYHPNRRQFNKGAVALFSFFLGGCRELSLEEIPDNKTSIIFYGEFWKYQVNPAETVATIMENQEHSSINRFEKIPVDYQATKREIEEVVKNSDTDTIIMLGVGGSQDTAFIEASAANKWPNPLPHGFDDPYQVEDGLLSGNARLVEIYPGDQAIRKLNPEVIEQIEQTITQHKWENIEVVENGNLGTQEQLASWTPCNTAVYTLIKACEENHKTGIFVHLPIDNQKAQQMSEIITALAESLQKLNQQ